MALGCAGSVVGLFSNLTDSVTGVMQHQWGHRSSGTAHGSPVTHRAHAAAPCVTDCGAQGARGASPFSRPLLGAGGHALLPASRIPAHPRAAAGARRGRGGGRGAAAGARLGPERRRRCPGRAAGCGPGGRGSARPWCSSGCCTAPAGRAGSRGEAAPVPLPDGRAEPSCRSAAAGPGLGGAGGSGAGGAEAGGGSGAGGSGAAAGAGSRRLLPGRTRDGPSRQLPRGRSAGSLRPARGAGVRAGAAPPLPRPVSPDPRSCYCREARRTVLCQGSPRSQDCFNSAQQLCLFAREQLTNGFIFH